MAIIIQQDDGLIQNANSYIDLEFANNYHSLRGNISWVNATDANKEIALIKAWQYIDTQFNFLGYKKTDIQNTKFPRLNIYDDRNNELSNIEIQLKNAQAEYALISLNGDLLVNQTPTAEKPVKSISQKVDVIEKSITYDTNLNSQTIFNFPNADGWLNIFLANGNNNSGLRSFKANGYY